jgi:hypothetical protein
MQVANCVDYLYLYKGEIGYSIKGTVSQKEHFLKAYNIK